MKESTTAKLRVEIIRAIKQLHNASKRRGETFTRKGFFSEAVLALPVDPGDIWRLWDDHHTVVSLTSTGREVRGQTLNINLTKDAVKRFNNLHSDVDAWADDDKNMTEQSLLGLAIHRLLIERDGYVTGLRFPVSGALRLGFSELEPSDGRSLDELLNAAIHELPSSDRELRKLWQRVSAAVVGHPQDEVRRQITDRSLAVLQERSELTADWKTPLTKQKLAGVAMAVVVSHER